MAIQLKRASQSTWKNKNPVLAYGEPGFVKETGELKIGDGVTAWNDLASINVDPLIVTANTTNADYGAVVDIDSTTIFEQIKIGRQVLLKFLNSFLSFFSVLIEETVGLPIVMFKGTSWEPVGESSARLFEITVAVIENDYSILELREIPQGIQTMNILKLTNN